MKPTASKLIRWTGLAALGAGIIFAGIQPIHPPDVLSSVTTGSWAIITTLKTVMCLLFLLGIAGIYARQVGKVGWLGLAGFLLLSLS
jgi:Na+/H+ antiporter NhaD/arsenite permease-like protein